VTSGGGVDRGTWQPAVLISFFESHKIVVAAKDVPVFINFNAIDCRGARRR
jgi:hypothetical protein